MIQRIENRDSVINYKDTMIKYKNEIQKGTQLCSRFAYRPNQLKFCGKTSATEKLLRCIQNGDCSGLEKEITKFKALHSYLKLIADKFRLPLLHYKVSEAYWIGNSLLDQFEQNDFCELVELFAFHGVPDFFLKELKEKFENSGMRFLPHHSFSVLFVGVGQVTSSVRYTLENINNCLIRWGTIREIQNTKYKIKAIRLVREKGILEMKNAHEVVEKGHEDNLKVGDIVATHWGSISIKLNEDQLQKLENYTRLLIEEFNNSGV